MAIIKVENKFLRPSKYNKSTYKGELILFVFISSIGDFYIITEKAEYNMLTDNELTYYNDNPLCYDFDWYENADAILTNIQETPELILSKY